MPRIPYPALSDEQRQAFESNPLNVKRMLFHLPPAIRAGISQTGRALLWDSDYDAQLRELVILRVAYLSGSAYEEHQHRAYGKRMGLTDDRIEAALAPRIGPPLTQREQAVLEFVEDVVRNVRPGDATLEAARRHLSDGAIFETLVLVGNYMMVARIIATSGIEIDAPGVVLARPGD